MSVYEKMLNVMSKVGYLNKDGFVETSKGKGYKALTDENFGNVTSTAIITVPRGCCLAVAVENTSAGLTAAEPSPAILVKNANLTVSRIA